MDKPVENDYRFIAAIKESIIEIVGESGASQFASSRHKSQPAGRYLQDLGNYFFDLYDIQSARGLLILIGRSTAGCLKRNHPEISALGTIERRLSPILHRFEGALNVLLSVVGPEIGMEITVDQASENEFLILSKNQNPENDHSLEYFLYFMKGLFEAIGSWLDSRKDYDVKILDISERQCGRLMMIIIKAAQ